jgi:hypothetical protein
MIYVWGFVILTAAALIFLKWWHGICEDGEKADKVYHDYVNHRAYLKSKEKKP